MCNSSNCACVTSLGASTSQNGRGRFGSPDRLKCSAEVNSACAEVLLRKTLVRRCAADMMDAPSEVTQAQLDELHIALVKPKE